jgi:nucleoside-diphosphate-sugar epimerase
MNILVTGADGFIGRALVAQLLSVSQTQLGSAVSQVTLLDQQFGNVPADPRVRTVVGDLADRDVLNRATHSGVDMAKPNLVFHLASIPGGLAERQVELGLRVNLEGTIGLLEAVRLQQRAPRFVFASTIGVYGVPLPDVVDESTLPAPTLSYGAQKYIGEILVSDYSRRGFIEGCALRLPGIVARPPQASGMLSAFLSDLIRQLSAGRQFTCPVAAEGMSWWMTRTCVVRNLLHAASMTTAQLHQQRVWLLPVLHASMADIVAAIARVHGDQVLRNVRYEPNAALQAQFANYPPLLCPRSVAAGFQHDGTLDRLVEQALE